MLWRATTRKIPCAACVPTQLNSASTPVSEQLQPRAAHDETMRNRIIFASPSLSADFRITQRKSLKYLAFCDFEPVGRELESLRAR